MTWIPVFKAGRWTDSAGNEREWTEEDLDRIVQQYDPAEHEAPVVIGHPKDNAPAWGWVEALKREGGMLYAKLKDLVPEFVEMVRKGLFKKRSISLYPDLRLRHVGFLGAVPPAVKGLPDVAFEEGDGAVEIEFADEGRWASLAAVLRRLREWIIEREGTEKADRLIPEWVLEEVAPSRAEEELSPAFAATDEAKEAQKRRSKKYGIGIKEGGHVTKPSEWDNVADDDFLDPVNYRYPCPDAEQTRAAARYWGMPKNKAQYTAAERRIIDRRLDAKMRKFGIGKYRKKKEGTNMSIKERFKALFVKTLDELPDDALEQLDAGGGGEPRTFSEEEVRAREEAAARKAKEEAERRFNEKIEAERRARRRAEIQAWCEGMAKEGRIVPAWMKMGLVDFMASLHDEGELEFAEGSDPPWAGEQAPATPLAWFKAFLEGLPKVVEFREVATREKDVGAKSAAERINELVNKKMKEEEGLSYAEALERVQRENPELAAEYAQELRGEAAA